MFDSRRLYRVDEIVNDPRKSLRGPIPVSRSTWYEGVKQGRYPRGVKLGERLTVWSGDVLNAFIAPACVPEHHTPARRRARGA